MKKKPIKPIKIFKKRPVWYQFYKLEIKKTEPNWTELNWKKPSKTETKPIENYKKNSKK